MKQAETRVLKIGTTAESRTRTRDLAHLLNESIALAEDLSSGAVKQPPKVQNSP